MDDFKVDWNADEREAIKNLAVSRRMSVAGIIRQAVRLYQHHDKRLSDGETCHYSGDAERARAFVGADADS